MHRSTRALLLLLACAAIVYLAGNERVSLWDRDEPRYAQTSRQMVQSGDWIVPMFLDTPRTAKPIFIYWCQASAMKLLGATSAAAARFPSVIAGLLTLCIVAAALWHTVGRRRALWTAFILATSALFIGSSKICLTDAVLLVWIAIAQIGLFLFLNNKLSWGMTLIVGTATGLAVLTKGPVVLGVAGMTWIAFLVLRRMSPHPKPRPAYRVRALRLGAVLLIAAGVYALWGIPIERRLPNYHRDTFQKEIVDRSTKPAEGHKGPPGYYLLTIWGTYLPWSLLIPATAVFAWKRRSNPTIHFAIAAIVGPWVMFEIVQTKLPHYLLPVFPPLAYLTARMLVYRFSRAKARPRTAIITGATMGAVVLIAHVTVFPFIQQIQISRNIAKVLITHGATTPDSVIMIDYKEPSLAFYQGGTIREERDNAYLQNTSAVQWTPWIVLTDKVWNETPKEIQSKWEEVGRVNGLAYANRMRNLDVIVLRKKT